MKPRDIVALILSHSSRRRAPLLFHIAFALFRLFLFFLLLLLCFLFLPFLLFFLFFQKIVIPDRLQIGFSHQTQLFLLPAFASVGIGDAFLGDCHCEFYRATEIFLTVNTIRHPAQQFVDLFTNDPELVDYFLIIGQ